MREKLSGLFVIFVGEALSALLRSFANSFFSLIRKGPGALLRSQEVDACAPRVLVALLPIIRRDLK